MLKNNSKKVIFCFLKKFLIYQDNNRYIAYLKFFKFILNHKLRFNIISKIIH